jgi:hypothetical protein
MILSHMFPEKPYSVSFFVFYIIPQGRYPMTQTVKGLSFPVPRSGLKDWSFIGSEVHRSAFRADSLNPRTLNPEPGNDQFRLLFAIWTFSSKLKRFLFDQAGRLASQRLG